jgi:hypothetical protein
VGAERFEVHCIVVHPPLAAGIPLRCSRGGKHPLPRGEPARSTLPGRGVATLAGAAARGVPRPAGAGTGIKGHCDLRTSCRLNAAPSKPAPLNKAGRKIYFWTAMASAESARTVLIFCSLSDRVIGYIRCWQNVNGGHHEADVEVPMGGPARECGCCDYRGQLARHDRRCETAVLVRQMRQ